MAHYAHKWHRHATFFACKLHREEEEPLARLLVIILGHCRSRIPTCKHCFVLYSTCNSWLCCKICQDIGAYIVFTSCVFIDTCATAWLEPNDNVQCELTIKRHGMSNGNQFPKISFRCVYMSKANFVDGIAVARHSSRKCRSHCDVGSFLCGYYLNELDTSQQQSTGRHTAAVKRISDLDLWTHDLEKLIVSWPVCRKYLCKFRFKSLPYSTGAIGFTRFLWSQQCLTLTLTFDPVTL